MTVDIQQAPGELRVFWPNGSGVTFELDVDDVLGVRAVEAEGVALRNTDTLWRPLLRTPEGVHYTRFVLKEARVETDGAVVVTAAAVGYRSFLREELDEYIGDMLEMDTGEGEVRDEFQWCFSPSHFDLDGREFDGFSYSYRFVSSSPARRVYRIFDFATWEIGGALGGNTLLFQGQLNPPVTDLAVDQHFTTACNYYGAEMQGVMGPEDRVSIQRLPRFATIQAFDFLVHDEGVLFNLYEPLEEVFSVLQSQQGENRLHFVDELRGDLSADFSTHPKHVLFHRLEVPLLKEEARNLWLRAYDRVHDAIRARHGIERSYVLPRVWTPQVEHDVFRVYDEDVPRERALYHLGDTVLPVWEEMGVKEICTPSLWVSDYTVDRLKTKEEHHGLQGNLVVSGICCVRVHEIDELWGGTDALAYFVKKAHRYGMKVQLWWASHLSRRAPIFAERPDFMLTARDGLPNGGGFGHDVLITLDLNNEDCFEWEYQRLKAVYEATGIDGLFHDSYGNLTFLPLNFADETRRGQQVAMERLMQRLQALGMSSFSLEGIGALGTGHFGMNLANTDPEAQGQYQNALDWWIGQEDMLYGLNLGMEQPHWTGRDEDAREFSFRAIANGGRFGFSGLHGNVELWCGWIKEHNQILAQVNPLAGRRTLLPNDEGVLWEIADGRRVLFAFRPHTLLAGSDAEITRVTASAALPLGSREDGIEAQAGEVYTWREVASDFVAGPAAVGSRALVGTPA